MPGWGVRDGSPGSRCAAGANGQLPLPGSAPWAACCIMACASSRPRRTPGPAKASGKGQGMARDDKLLVQANGDKELYKYLKQKEKRERREKRRNRWSFRITVIIVLCVLVFLYLLTKVRIVWIW